MAQNIHGWRAMFSLPELYDLAQILIGAGRARCIIASQYLSVTSAARILDIGCGTGRLLDHLPLDVSYVGVDLSQRYIDAAQSRYGGRGQFYCADVATLVNDGLHGFDYVVVMGLLHHLDDEPAQKMMGLARSALREGGRLVAMEPCRDEGQSAVARWLIDRDRGRNVRTLDGYARIARTEFERVRTRVRTDLIHVPYTHAILECEK